MSNYDDKYKKKPAWYWVLVYLIVGIIVYAIIYLVFFSNPSPNGSITY